MDNCKVLNSNQNFDDSFYSFRFVNPQQFSLRFHFYLQTLSFFYHQQSNDFNQRNCSSNFQEIDEVKINLASRCGAMAEVEADGNCNIDRIHFGHI
jgi:hypothetical protein